MLKRAIFYLLVLPLFMQLTASAQSRKPIPERLITINVSNRPTEQVLELMAKQGAFEFSYSPTTIDVKKPVTINCVNCPVREVLTNIFSGSVGFREKGNYLILHRKQSNRKSAGTGFENESTGYIIFTGYVRNATMEHLPWVTVYDRASLEVAVTNDYGYYRISFRRDQLPATLYFSKTGYNDTAIFVSESTPGYFNVVLQKRKPVVVHEYSTQPTASASPAIFEILENTTVSQNISDTLHRKWQLSLVPYAGTNGLLSGSVINDYSFNLFGGYSMGIAKAEFSGFVNLNRSDISYLQLAGFTNLTGGNVRGVQMAGFLNTVRGDVNGIQLAGFMNTDFGYHTGGAFSGFLNSSIKDVTGVQISGFMNLAGGKLKGVQLAGFANLSRRNVDGVQVSGFVNLAGDTMRGTQAGFINAVKHIEGTQLGIFNLAHSTTGIPVGLLSYVHKGYHKLEISTDEAFNANIAFRTGVKAFHNIIISGVDITNDSLLVWHYGYGAGTTMDVSKRVAIDFDLTASQIVYGNRNEKIHLLAKGYLGTDIAIVKHFSICLGLTLNSRIFKTDYNKYPDLFSWYEPNIFYDHTWELDRTRLQMWLGAKLGLRFL